MNSLVTKIRTNWFSIIHRQMSQKFCQKFGSFKDRLKWILVKNDYKFIYTKNQIMFTDWWKIVKNWRKLFFIKKCLWQINKKKKKFCQKSSKSISIRTRQEIDFDWKLYESREKNYFEKLKKKLKLRFFENR